MAGVDETLASTEWRTGFAGAGLSKAGCIFVPGILQARTLEWVAISSSQAWIQEVLIGNWMNGSGVQTGSEPGIKDE